jgi:hypothetical protein
VLFTTHLRMPPDLTASVACGFSSGLLQAALFNPYDRAMYLSIHFNRPFLSKSNWAFRESFVGVLPSLLQRAVSSGLYFPMEQYFRGSLAGSKGSVDALAGIFSGAATGFLTSPINAAKFSQWREARGRSAVDSARAVYESGGLRALMRAAPVTVSRDLTFGMCFSFLRHRGESGLAENIGAASVATVISSPLNYVRMRQYSAPGGPPSAVAILRELGRQASAIPTIPERLAFMATACNMGWGALRVGLGIGITGELYDVCTRNYDI